MKKYITITTNEDDPQLSDAAFTVTVHQRGITEERLKDWLRIHQDAEVHYLNDLWPEEPKAAVRASKPLGNKNSIMTKYEIRE